MDFISRSNLLSSLAREYVEEIKLLTRELED